MEEKPFTKFDTSKTRLELLDPSFVVGVGEVLTFGAQKYSPNNWKKADVEGIERIKGASFRHLMAYLDGEKYDPETGLNHMFHIGCNAMFLTYFDKKEKENGNG